MYTDERVSISKAAKMIGVSTLTLKRWEAKGRIKPDRINKRRDRRYRIEDIEKLVQEYKK